MRPSQPAQDGMIGDVDDQPGGPLGDAGGGCVDQVGNYSWGAAQFFLPHVIGTHDPVAGKVTHWATYDHDVHGFIYVARNSAGAYEPDAIQKKVVADSVAFFRKHMG